MMNYDNHFLFSETYLREIFGKIKKDEISEFDNIFENIYSWYHEYKETWNLFEDIVIDTLGFEKTPEDPYKILKCDLGEPVAIAYLLNADCDLNSSVKGKYYAVDAVKFARSKNINWVIVTNGTHWRLYSAQGVSPYEFYFDVNIKDELESGSASEATRALGRIFGAKAYIHDKNGTCLMDKFKEQSDYTEESIEDVLRSKAESILKGLCYGLKDNMHLIVFDEMQRKQIYDDAIVLLYRLLFLGYAEARNLLPVIENDPDYQDSFSALCETARDYYMSGNLNTVGENFDLWTRLDSQIRIYVDKNYNGGLFSNEDKLILKEYRIANKHLAVCLMELAYVGGKKNDYSMRIEYKDLSVRNLGAIYEGLLEYQLFIADELMVQRKSKEKVSYHKAADIRLTNNDRNNLVQPGEIYLSQDAMERKETGAFYTPEDVVEYIVKNTVGVKLSELKSELDGELAGLRDELSYEPVELNRKMLQKEIDEKTIDFINEKILSLSIIDSAMGSGHFLVNAAYQVANFIVDLLETNCWKNEEINADVSYWKRRVVENCIYGIDINNLSVLLARLSLWLISVSNDKALSFIDHHLKCGNSIVGTTLNRVQYFDKDFPILTVTKKQYMYPVLRKYKEIKLIGSDTKADVEQQHKIYDEITADLKVIKKKLDYYLASQYAGGITDTFEFHNVLLADDISYFDNDDMNSLFQCAEINKFFHWEIEFPEVYMKGGFDAAIGNPPYVECSSEPYEYVGLRTLSSRNLYSYMMETSINHLTKAGRFGFIIPIAAMYSNNMNTLQEYLLEKNTLYISNYAKRPSKMFKKAEQRLSIIMGIFDVEDPEVYSTTYNRWYADERKYLFRNLEYQKIDNPRKYKFVPKIGNVIENDILEKIYASHKCLKDYFAKKEYKEYFIYHSVGHYWLKAFDFMPQFKNEKTGATVSSKYNTVGLKDDISSAVIICLINSSLFYWLWIMMSAERDFTRKDIEDFPFDYEMVTQDDILKFEVLKNRLMKNYQEYSKISETTLVTGKMILQEFHPKHGKEIIDEIDALIGHVYGFTDEEIAFVCNFDLRFRMGDE